MMVRSRPNYRHFAPMPFRDSGGGGDGGGRVNILISLFENVSHLFMIAYLTNNHIGYDFPFNSNAMHSTSTININSLFLYDYCITLGVTARVFITIAAALSQRMIKTVTTAFVGFPLEFWYDKLERTFFESSLKWRGWLSTDFSSKRCLSHGTATPNIRQCQHLV